MAVGKYQWWLPTVEWAARAAKNHPRTGQWAWLLNNCKNAIAEYNPEDEVQVHNMECVRVALAALWPQPPPCLPPRQRQAFHHAYTAADDELEGYDDENEVAAMAVAAAKTAVKVAEAVWSAGVAYGYGGGAGVVVHYSGGVPPESYYPVD